MLFHGAVIIAQTLRPSRTARWGRGVFWLELSRAGLYNSGHCGGGRRAARCQRVVDKLCIVCIRLADPPETHRVPTTIADQWDRALALVRAKVGADSFARWFEPLRARSIGPATIAIDVPNEFFRDWFSAHYLAMVRALLGEEIAVELAVSAGEAFPAAAAQAPGAATGAAVRSAAAEARLNTKYTFEQFVVGPSNRFAHAASLAVAESPARAYNPLFIYGGVGLGKTHLMQAIGHAALARAPEARLVYVPGEAFTNQLITAIQTKTTARFRDQYRTVDVLLIDDVHFLAGKEATQEEFFHTFNALYDAHKQIVLSSDRPPKEIAGLEERLISRFEWGLVTDIQPPDLETRIAILRKKVELAATPVPPEVLTFIAERVRTNVRELEGALIRVVASARFATREVTLDQAQETLKEMLVETQRAVTAEAIQRRVVEFFGISPEELRGKKRTRMVAYPRQVAMYLIRELTEHSLTEIGGLFGGRDHTTVLHACEKITREVDQDPNKRVLLSKLAALARSP